MRLLVTGGAGYIGSHMVRILMNHGYDVVAIDDLSNGHRDAIPSDRLIVESILNKNVVVEVLREYEIEAVLHFAGKSEVGESVNRPDIYYMINVCGSRCLLDAMNQVNVKKLVFSSTAAVYGEPREPCISEDHPKDPTNPYGASKWMVERMLPDEARANDLSWVSLRYFNAAGAMSDGSLGERHDPETHLIPLACQVASGRRSHLKIYGSDYPTPDGTCIRDFIHVQDLCSAHLNALEYLLGGGQGVALNLGYGQGASVREILHAVERISGRNVKVVDGPRREGDPSRLVANSERARTLLRWTPQFDSVNMIVRDAWRWEQVCGEG